jgi:hypothetical protein
VSAEIPKDVCIETKLPDDRCLGRVTSLVEGAMFQFRDVDLLLAVDENAQFLGLESLNKNRNYVHDTTLDHPAEPPPEGLELLGDVFVKQEISIKQTVLLSVVERHLDLISVMHQFLHNNLSKQFELNVEVQLQIVYRLSGLQNGFKRPVYLGFDFFQILDYLQTVLLFVCLVQQLFEGDLREVDVEMHAVV